MINVDDIRNFPGADSSDWQNRKRIYGFCSEKISYNGKIKDSLIFEYVFFMINIGQKCLIVDADGNKFASRREFDKHLDNIDMFPGFLNTGKCYLSIAYQGAPLGVIKKGGDRIEQAPAVNLPDVEIVTKQETDKEDIEMENIREYDQPTQLNIIKKEDVQIEQARILKPKPDKEDKKIENPYRQNLRIFKQASEAAQAQSVSLTEPYIAKKELEIEAEQLVSTRERNLKIATGQCPKLTPQIVIEGLANLIGRAEIAKNMINKQGLVISNNKGLTIPNPALKIEADTLKAIADIFKKINASKKDAKLKNSDIIKPPRHRVKIHYSCRFEDSYFWMD